VCSHRTTSYKHFSSNFADGKNTQCIKLHLIQPYTLLTAVTEIPGKTTMRDRNNESRKWKSPGSNHTLYYFNKKCCYSDLSGTTTGTSLSLMVQYTPNTELWRRLMSNVSGYHTNAFTIANSSCLHVGTCVQEFELHPLNCPNDFFGSWNLTPTKTCVPVPTSVYGPNMSLGLTGFKGLTISLKDLSHNTSHKDPL